MAPEKDTTQIDLTRGIGPIHTVLRGIVWVCQAAAWLIVPIMMLVLTGVILSAAKVGTVFRWEEDVFLFGSKLTLASIGDLQWHLFGIMLMLTIAGTMVNDQHVRVDFLRQQFSQRTKDIIEIIGNLGMLLPLCLIVILNGYDFTLRSFSMGEGSDYDGLYDRFVLKAFIPIGFGLMLLAALGLTIQKLRNLFRKGRDHD